ncbi:MAG: hypothetical protein H0U95_00110 [Bacteroidetes bacterium]|nr:hypothetical protein [Bacteroidota bacterium]
MLRLTKKENTVNINFDIYLINRSNTDVNLFILASSIKKQIESVYSGKFSSLELTTIATIKPIYKHQLRLLYNNLVIAISDHVTNDNVAEADFGGLLIKLNPKHIDSINSGKNKRTIAHELGHILGLDHPHANAKFESVNTAASLLEQNITNEEKKYNLMCQGWYIQKANIDLNDALVLTENQIIVILENYFSKKLNKNYSLAKGIFNYKWIGKI